MNDIDEILTGNVCDSSCQPFPMSIGQARYVRWEECAAMRRNYKERVDKQFDKVDDQIDSTNEKIDKRFESLELKIDQANIENGNRLDLMNTNLINVSNAMTLAALGFVVSLALAVLGAYLIFN